MDTYSIFEGAIDINVDKKLDAITYCIL